LLLVKRLIYALRVPESLFEYARTVAEEEKTSMNQFFVTAIAEKVSALKTESYFRERLARGRDEAFDAWLQATPDAPPEAGDERPPQ
jgi:hypothetical protein